MNQTRPNAWRYRDWVIESLNADLPYDAFVRARLAQWAGDRTAMTEHLRAASTGDWPAPLARRLLR